MNTPSHAILNLLLLGQGQSMASALPITLGAILPDVPIFVFYAWAKGVRRQPERQIWRTTYYHPFWQDMVAGFHSIPLALLGGLFAITMGWSAGAIACGSMVLHSLLDLPVHNHDAHRHFFPFSNYRFISPISYWDPRYRGRLVSIIERALVLVAVVTLFPTVQSWLGKGLLLLTSVFYLAEIIYFRLFKPCLGVVQSGTSEQRCLSSGKQP